jgi:hypothetical protein
VGPKTWNTLSDDLKKIPISKFKKIIVKEIVMKY